MLTGGSTDLVVLRREVVEMAVWWCRRREVVELETFRKPHPAVSGTLSETARH